MVKAIARRRGDNFVPLVQQKLGALRDTLKLSIEHSANSEEDFLVNQKIQITLFFLLFFTPAVLKYSSVVDFLKKKKKTKQLQYSEV